MRTVVAVILIVLVLGVGYSGPPRLFLHPRDATLVATPLAPPPVATSGRLTWLGGVSLSGSDRAAGGYSAIAARIRPGGTRFLLVSDGGNLTWFTIGTDWRARDARFGELPGGPRTGWEKRDRDAESVALDPRGRSWVGFESVNGIWRYPPGFATVERGVRPRAMRRWARNGGPEAMARLPDGRFLVLSEESHWPTRPGRAGIVFAGDPVARPGDGFGFSYRPAPGFDPVDVAVLPGGDLLVLEREWRLPVRFRSRIALVRRSALKPGAVVTGTEVGRIASPWPTENYEGLAVTREGAATIVWLVSDDDQSGWRHSYLLKLRLEPETAAARRPERTTGRR